MLLVELLCDDDAACGMVFQSLSITDVLSCAQVCKQLRQLAVDMLQTGVHSTSILERGTSISGVALLRIATQRLDPVSVLRVDVSDCTELTKAQISNAVAALPSIEELIALRVGPGSWSSKHMAKLLSSAPPSLKRFRIDVLVEMKNDLHEGSAFLEALANPLVMVEKLTLISDNVTRSAKPLVGGADAAAVAAAAAAAAAAADEAAASLAAVDIGDDLHNADDVGEDTADMASAQAADLSRLGGVLLPTGNAPSALQELDASSGALDVPGASSLLLAPLLASPGCALRCLSVCHLSRSGLRSLAQAVSQNATLCTLSLNSNMIYGSATAHLAQALKGHEALTSLSLDHNPVLDAGGSALAAVLPSTRIDSLSLCFTGVADRTCAALGLALGTASCRLRDLKLTGNRVTSAGAGDLAASLGSLRSLDLTANITMDADGTVALAKALPGSSLRALRLAGCKVDKKACSRLAAALVQSRLALLDISCNHFGSAGSDELAWVLGECESLATLNLSDCNIEDEGADELLDALTDADTPAKSLRSLDLRWNKLSAPKHQGGNGVSADPRVDASCQKQQTAADRQSAHLEQTFQQSKAAGKKVYVPKWAREQQQKSKARSTASGGTGSAMS